MRKEIDIRKAKVYDLHFLGKLRDEVNPFLHGQYHFYPQKQKKFWNEQMATKKYLLWIICVGKHKAGYLQLRNFENGSAEFGIAILEKYREKKLGGMAIQRFMRIVRQMKLKRLWLTVKKDNPRAMALFEKSGFCYIAREDDNAYHMELIL